MTVNTLVGGGNRAKTCPSPSFDARSLKSAKWSQSSEDIKHESFKDIPKFWSPRNQPSPSPEVKPINFDSNSLKRVKRSVSTDSAYNSPDPKDSFAWKDSTLERKLKDLKARELSDAPPPKHRDNDNSLGRTLENWKSTPLPKVEDPDVLLLKKARQEKKVKRYLEDNFKNRAGSFSGGLTDSEVGSLQAKYNTLERDSNIHGSPPHSPPPFSKVQSRFEREQKIKVGSLDSFTPGATLDRQRSLSPPPSASSAQAKYERERFRVEPGRIENYRPGRCSVNSDKRSSNAGCSITKYSGSHSFNPLLSSKSEVNLAKASNVSNTNSLQRDRSQSGYESDSTLSFRKHNYTPTSGGPSKQLFTKVEAGSGESSTNGIRMSASDNDARIPSIKVFQGGDGQRERPASVNSGKTWDRQNRWTDMREAETEKEVKERQQLQLNQFYNTLSHQKETKQRQDQENRKHHDTLLPNQKSPVPLNRYEDQDVNCNQASFLNAGRKPEDCKSVARALYSFQAQNNRELGFKKGDIIYIKKQVDGNWFEGERNALVGIFPTTYVEIIPSENIVTQEITRSLTRKEKSREGEGRAKFNFTAQTPMELSLIKGETIAIVRRIDENWYEGRIGNRKGIFPVSYVQVDQEPGQVKTTSSSGHQLQSSSGHQQQTMTSSSSSSILKSSSYTANYEKPRSMAGTLSPYSTLSRPTSSLSGHHQDKPEPVPYRAMYNYKPQNEDEVELCEGDVVFVMEKCDDGWFVGTSQRTGIFGTFPGNYVTQV